MKIVIISQQFFPSLLPRSHRATELAKEFARRGHEVIVYALLGNFNYESFTKETGVVVRNLGISKFGLYDSTEIRHAPKLIRLFNHLFGKMLWLPDRELVPMVKKALSNVSNVDCVISIAVPHIIHYAISQCSLGECCWIADCGDPFMLNPLSNRPKYLEKCEREWCEACDYITVPIKEAVDGYYPEYRNKIRVIPQGFDFKNVKLAEYHLNDIPTFGFAGSIYPGHRDPYKLLEYLESREERFRFVVFGGPWPNIEKFQRIHKMIEFKGRIPRNQLVVELSKMDFLINIKNGNSIQQPSKLIDYAQAGRPILSISSELSLSDIQNLDSFFRKDYDSQYVVDNLFDYDIVHVVDKFVSLIDRKQSCK